MPEREQDARTPFAPRCTKDLVEERLFAHRRDLFSRLDLVFMDTTSLYFEGAPLRADLGGRRWEPGAGGQTLGRHGHSKDHRPDLPQMILAVLIDGDGRPVCSEMWPGNVADARRQGRGWGPFPPTSRRDADPGHRPAAPALRDRPDLRGRRPWHDQRRDGGVLYLLGTRERSDKVVRDVVLADSAPWVPLTIAKRGHEIDHEAKAVTVGGRRYILCRNHQEARRDAAARDAILANLERQLARGDKALVGNTGFRRFLTTEGHGHFAIDPAKAEQDARFDGIFVLRTNTDLDPLAAMLRSKQLWIVEATFRLVGREGVGAPSPQPAGEPKHLLATRPIFHKLDQTVRGHVFASFLALVLEAELEQRIADLGRTVSWTEILADLDSPTETEIAHGDKRFLVRSSPRPAASLALRAAGVALPPTVQPLAVD